MQIISIYNRPTFVFTVHIYAYSAFSMLWGSYSAVRTHVHKVDPNELNEHWPWVEHSSALQKSAVSTKKQRSFLFTDQQTQTRNTDVR